MHLTPTQVHVELRNQQLIVDYTIDYRKNVCEKFLGSRIWPQTWLLSQPEIDVFRMSSKSRSNLILAIAQFRKLPERNLGYPKEVCWEQEMIKQTTPKLICFFVAESQATSAAVLIPQFEKT